jgi:hypothetical protein
MPNKTILTAVSFIIIAAAVLLTALTPENKFFHLWYQASILAVVILSMYMGMKDIFIIVMIFSCVVWGMGFFDVIKQMHQLMIETSIVLLSGLALGFYELNYKKEKHSRDTIMNYKKGEIEGLASRISGLNKENHNLTEDLKSMRKYFTK